MSVTAAISTMRKILQNIVDFIKFKIGLPLYNFSTLARVHTERLQLLAEASAVKKLSAELEVLKLQLSAKLTLVEDAINSLPVPKLNQDIIDLQSKQLRDSHNFALELEHRVQQLTFENRVLHNKLVLLKVPVPLAATKDFQPLTTTKDLVELSRSFSYPPEIQSVILCLLARPMSVADLSLYALISVASAKEFILAVVNNSNVIANASGQQFKLLYFLEGGITTKYMLVDKRATASVQAEKIPIDNLV